MASKAATSPTDRMTSTSRPAAAPRAPRVVRSPRNSVPADLTIATLAAGMFAALGIAAHHDLLQEVNQRVRTIVRRRDPRTVRIARTITLLSESGVHPILGWIASKGASRVVGRTYVPFAASLAVFVLNKGTRLFVHQPRPPGAKPRRGLDRRGYPSGHTLAATAIAFATALEIAEGRPIGQRSALFAAAAAYAATIGWTRLALDEHWIDDVVGAWAGGIALAIIVTQGSRHRAASRSYSRTGSCTSIGRFDRSSQRTISASAFASSAVHPAVVDDGPAQMCRKMHDPRPGVGGRAL